jgi:hypothetical protein
MLTIILALGMLLLSSLSRCHHSLCSGNYINGGTNKGQAYGFKLSGLVSQSPLSPDLSSPLWLCLSASLSVSVSQPLSLSLSLYLSLSLSLILSLTLTLSVEIKRFEEKFFPAQERGDLPPRCREALPGTLPSHRTLLRWLETQIRHSTGLPGHLQVLILCRCHSLN